MTMNKTPIQELIDDLAEYCDFYVGESDKWLQKEKQSAFDCWSDGVKYSADRLSFGKTSSIEDRFEQFYSQYAEQHKK